MRHRRTGSRDRARRRGGASPVHWGLVRRGPVMPRPWCLALLGLLVFLAVPRGTARAGDGPPGKGAKPEEWIRAWRDAKDATAAQAAGRRILKELPDDAASFEVLERFVKEGWTVPRLSTSYATLRAWAYDRIDGKTRPDARLAFLDLIERDLPASPMVKEGGILYAKSWCHAVAKRYDQAIELGERYVTRFPKGSNVDDARWTVAEAMLALSPPDLAGAKRHLKAIVSMEKSDRKEAAERLLLAVEAGGADVQPTEGFPRAEGLGKVVLLSNWAASDPMWKALERWRTVRKAEVVRFAGDDVRGAATALRRIGPEFVALAVSPGTVDVNFHLDALELCRGLDADPMPDFSFGYLTARDAEDLARFADRILAKEATGGTRAAITMPTSTGLGSGELDLALHFGHGTPTDVVDAASAAQISAFDLRSGPVVLSGACFNGVLSRSFHPCAYHMAFEPPVAYAPEKLVSLAWIHAGATGYLASLEADRGEMALAEWAYLHETAAPLGEVIGHQYRLAFTSLPATYAGFPRYRPGVAKRMGFYDVMLRGAVARILVGDPSYRPLKAPLAAPTTRTDLRMGPDGRTCVATIEVLRYEQGDFLNYLPDHGDGTFDARVTARIALPEGFTSRLEAPEATVELDGAAVPVGRSIVRHEVWGGRRYVNLQVEGRDGRLAQKGARVTFRFGVR